MSIKELLQLPSFAKSPKVRKIVRIAGSSFLVLLVVLLVAGFASRQYFLHRMAHKRIAEIQQRYNLKVHYTDLEMKGISSIHLQGLSVVPIGQDTLLSLQRLDIRLMPWKLLVGSIQVKEVRMDNMHLNFVKIDSVANYDFLFKNSPKETPAKRDGETNYAAKAHTLLNLLNELIPDNGRITRLWVSERHNAHKVNFRLPDLPIQDNRFTTLLQVSEDSLPAQEWRISGKLLPDQRSVQIQMHAAHGQSLRIPYLQRRIGAAIQFDSLACNLTEVPDGRRHTTLNGYARIAGLEIYHRALSPDTIRLDKGDLQYLLQIHPNAVELDSATRLTVNQLSFHPYIRLEHKAHPTTNYPLAHWHLRASVNQPWFPAQQLFGSLPKGLFNVLSGIETQGQLSYHGLLDLDFDRLDSMKLESDLKKNKDFRIVHYGNTNLGKMNGEFEYTAYENGRPLRSFPVGPSWEHFTPLDSISPLLQNAVMQSEDGLFFYHQGFLIDAMREAIIKDLKVRRFARGGSTISMQLVKNVFLNRNKNIARKVEEALIVWLIENQRISSKARMYEVYMNIIEWGPMVYGAQEAAQFYFDKRPSQLTLEESIFLASIVPKPKHFQSSFGEDGQLRESLGGYFRLIAGKLARKGLVSEGEAESIRPVINVTGPAREYLHSSLPDSIHIELPEPTGINFDHHQ